MKNLKNKTLNTKSSKGITLVALIITIIVLLILAVVAIAAVNDTGIINYADNSVDTYKAGRDNEIAILQNYVDYINEKDPSKKTEEAIWGEFQGILLYIGASNTLKVTSDTIQVETIEVNVQDFTYTRTGVIKEAKISDYTQIAFMFSPNIKSVDFGGILTSNHNFAFGDTSIESITGLDGISRIPEYIFKDCTTLKSIIIPKSVLEIGEEAFKNCDGLMEITIPGSVLSIGKNAFYGCDGLKNVIIDDGVNSIGEYAFEGCDLLDKVTIPESVASINNGAFKELSNLKEINYNSTKDNWSKIYSVYAFGSGINAEVICTDGKYKIENNELIELSN